MILDFEWKTYELMANFLKEGEQKGFFYLIKHNLTYFFDNILL
jgi:hypothetical protein